MGRNVKIIVKAVVFILFLAGAFYLGGLNKENPTPIQNSLEEVGKVSVMLDYGNASNGRIQVFEVPWSERQTVFSALEYLRDSQGLALASKDYGEEMGVFVEAIGGFKGEGDAWWQYWVNNQYGKVSAGFYKLNHGDVVEWKLTKGQTE